MVVIASAAATTSSGPRTGAFEFKRTFPGPLPTELADGLALLGALMR